ncbi:MAG: ATP synthase subunit I [Terriglobales bacterium]
MPDNFQPETPTADLAAERFYGAALERIKRFMIVIGIVATATVWPLYGWQVAVGLALGCAIAWINFHWLKTAVSAFADRITQSGETRPATGIVVRFMLRYALIALGAYAIFNVYKYSLYGLLGGLFLTVAAILCEAAYEVAVSLRRGI